jgi:hypothetical protein
VPLNHLKRSDAAQHVEEQRARRCTCHM